MYNDNLVLFLLFLVCLAYEQFTCTDVCQALYYYMHNSPLQMYKKMY